VIVIVIVILRDSSKATVESELLHLHLYIVDV
jgi:hypothetical protein